MHPRLRGLEYVCASVSTRFAGLAKETVKISGAAYHALEEVVELLPFIPSSSLFLLLDASVPSPLLLGSPAR